MRANALSTSRCGAGASSTRARTVTLAGLVGTQLAQTLTLAGRSPLVAGTTIVSVAGLVAIIQTPGLSHVFDCRALGPVGWSIAAGCAVIAIGAGAAASRWLL